MTEEQLYALKCFIEAKIEEAISPSFENEQILKIEEDRLDREMLGSAPVDNPLKSYTIDQLKYEIATRKS